MRLSSLTVAFAFLAVTCLSRLCRRAAAPLPAPQPGRHPLRSQRDLHAQLYKPDGDGPFPVVIALHGCGGLGGHSEPVQPRYRDWAEQLLKGGKAVLLPDSYGSRELGPQCHVKERRITARRERVADILAARQWLMQQPWVAHDRISLLGWANGASALLWAVRPQLSSRHAEPDFRSAIAFYPDCRSLVAARLERARSDAGSDRRQGRRQFAAGLPPDGRRRPWPQRAGADRGLSQRLSRFRPRQSAASRDRSNADAADPEKGPSRHRRGSPRQFAKARRRMAGAMTAQGRTGGVQCNLEQASLVDRFDDALRCGRLRFVRGRLRRAGAAAAPAPHRRSRRRVRRQIRCSSRAPGPTLGSGMHRVARLVAHQRKTARQHAAIGQRAKQLPAMGDPRRQAAASPVASARRARSASRCTRSRSRAIAWRCACALESFEAFSLIASPAKRSLRLPQQRSAPNASSVRRTPSAAVGPARAGRAAPASSAVR